MARLGLRVGCLLGGDPPAAAADELLELEDAGVSLRLVELSHGPIFENLEAGGHRRQRWLSRSDPLLGQVRETYVRLPIYPKTHYVMSAETREKAIASIKAIWKRGRPWLCDTAP